MDIPKIKEIKKILFFDIKCLFLINIFILLLNHVTKADESGTFELSFSTYFGGSGWEHARDVFVDNEGNIYMVGGTASSDFPTTAGAYDRTFDPGYDGKLGPCDVFVSKFDSDGSLIWSTIMGGLGYDRAYAVEVDDLGYIYVAGRAGTGFPIKNGFQSTFQGVDNPNSYGKQNAFVAKIKPDGSDLIWSSYVGVSPGCRDLAIDKDGDIYVIGGRQDTSNTPPSGWFVNAFQKTPPGGSDSGVIKIKGDGSQVIWATWLGGSGDDSTAASIRVDDNEYVYIGLSTDSVDIPTTTGAHDRSYSGDGEVDFYVAKIEPDGSDLVYGTYLGGAGHQWISTHNLAIDNDGNAYVAVPTGADFPTTENVFQSVHGGGNTDWGIAKLSPNGELIASTFVGGNGEENPDGIYVDTNGNVYISGETESTSFPVTQDAYQSTNGGGHDAVLVVLSEDFKQLFYSTYMGGSEYDNGRASFLDFQGNIYITGSADGSGWPLKDAYQDQYAGGVGQCCGMGDCILAKFSLKE